MALGGVGAEPGSATEFKLLDTALIKAMYPLFNELEGSLQFKTASKLTLDWLEIMQP
jgi:hypothetical protein